MCENENNNYEATDQKDDPNAALIPDPKSSYNTSDSMTLNYSEDRKSKDVSFVYSEDSESE